MKLNILYLYTYLNIKNNLYINYIPLKNLNYNNLCTINLTF